MITTFRVQNYKALRDVTLQVTPMHLLIGPNDSGKTSILEALAALSRLSADEPMIAFRNDCEGRELVWRHEDSQVVLSAQGDNGGEFAIAATFSDRQRSGFAGFGIQTPVPVIQAIKTNSEDEQSSVHIEFKHSLSPVEKYRFNPALMLLPTAATPSSPFRLDETGFGLPRCLDFLVGVQRKSFRRLEERFQRVFPQVVDIVLKPEQGMQLQRGLGGAFSISSAHDGKSLYFRLKGINDDVPARQMSDGALIVLAFLTILLLPNPPRLLLIEEPENGIHPERLIEIIRILRELHAEHHETQIVMTSHSPYIVSLFEPDEVTLCHKNDQGEVQVKRLSDSQIVREQLKIFSLGEIWPAEEERIFKESNDTVPVPAEATP